MAKKTSTKKRTPKGWKWAFHRYNEKKGRKGTYWVGRSPEGKRTRIKYGYEPVDFYLEGFKRGFTGRQLRKAIDQAARGMRKGVDNKQYRNYRQAITRRGGKSIKKLQHTINTVFKQGMTRVTFDLHQLNHGVVKSTYEKLFRPLVLDKELLGEVIRNAHKFSHRYEYNINLNGLEGERGKPTAVGNILDSGNRHLQKFLGDYITGTDLFHHGANIDYDWKNRVSNHLNLPLDTIRQHIDSGSLLNGSVTMTFRKGQTI